MARRDPGTAPSRDDVLAGASEIVAGTFGLLRAKGSTAPKVQRNARIVLSIASIAGGAGQMRGNNTLLGVKIAGYVIAFAAVVIDKVRNRN